MRDQAENLRRKLQQNKSKRAKAIAVVSGKGGVGKSNVSINFALSLAKRGQRILIFDMDIGMGNIDILIGVTPTFTFVDLFKQDMRITEVITKGHGISFIAGGSGFTEIFKLGHERIRYFTEQLETLFYEYDYVIFDMGAGVTEDSLQIALISDELFVVTTPEPTAMTDAYATIKFFSLKERDMPIFLVINRSKTSKEAEFTQLRLKTVVTKFLGRDMIYLGDLPEDQIVSKAVKQQTPFLLHAPHASISKAMEQMTSDYEAKLFNQQRAASSSFITKLKQLFS